MASVDPDRFEAAATRFVEFFNELGKTFVEREELLAQVALALLGREHVLMTGPPGTAKSGMATAVLRRIVDETSRAPSVFARQFTESTVQTDLVGPINFKTLMETGRTEHFTDEGMLGAVHAFLDEVFDGRDMLLRSTLNVLQERELKQGAKTTRGQIECALMTTNRYLAEVLEGSRETLLAFVDRIAFVSFVPKSFAREASLPNVLKRQLGQLTPLRADLTIQDLDALQAVVDAIPVPDAICDALTRLLAMMDVELAAAERSDPHFLPTRYLSTRTAVRLGKILRAVCVYDRLFYRKDRPLEVEHADLGGLRLSLLLGGPMPDALDVLLKTETDARERRQLSIVRTEREIFDRCLAKLPESAAPTKKRAAKEAKEAKEASKLRAMGMSLDKQETSTLVAATHKLALEANAPPLAAAEAEKLLERTVAELSTRALRAGLTANASAGVKLDAFEVASELGALADDVEKAAGATRPLARWLRGRAIALIDEAARLGVSPKGAALDAGQPNNSATARKLAEPLLASAEKLAYARKRLVAQGAAADDGEEAWARAIERLETDVSLVLEEGFRADVEEALKSLGGGLEAMVIALAAPLEGIDACAASITAIAAKPSKLKARVTGPRLRPLVAAAFERIQAPDRVKLVSQVERLLETLATASLQEVLPPKDLLAMTAEALVRSANAAPRPAERPLDRATYRKLRLVDQRVPGAFTLLEIAMRVSPELARDFSSPNEAALAIAELARDLPAEVSRAVAALDIERLDRAIGFLEKWWAAMPGDAATPDDRIRTWTESKFFHVTRDEQALARTALECRLVAEVFPSVADEVAALCARLDALDAASGAALAEAQKQRSDAAWSAALGQREA